MGFYEEMLIQAYTYQMMIIVTMNIVVMTKIMIKSRITENLTYVSPTCFSLHVLVQGVFQDLLLTHNTATK